MIKPRKISPPDVVHILLNYRDSYLRSKENEERESEQRVKFFLAVVTAALAVIGVILKEGYFLNHRFLIAFFSLVILFSYGLLTFARITWRSRANDRLDGMINTLNKSIEALDPFVHQTLTPILKNDSEPKLPFIRDLKGTLAQFIYLTESLLAAAIIWTTGNRYSWPLWCTWPLLVMVFFVVGWLLYKWSRYIRKQLL